MKKWKKAAAGAISASLLLPGIAGAEVPLEAKEQQYKAAQTDNKLTDMRTLVIRYDKALPQSVHKQAGVTLLRRLPALKYDIVRVPASKKVKDVVAVYEGRTEVKTITPSIQFKTFAAKADPKAASMDHLAMLNVTKALQKAGKHDVTIAVIDEGVDYTHADLKANMLKPYNAVNPARNPVRGLHGTHVAGIIGSVKDNGLGGYGVFPQAKILPVDVFNGSMGASDFAIAEGIVYAVDNGADVLNLSLGAYMSSPVMEEAVRYAIDSDVTVVTAAGNESTGMYSYPSSYPGVINVGNVSGDKSLSDSSNFGPSVDIVAPGENIYSTSYHAENGSKFERLTGTSMSAPMVAAAAGLLKSKYPDLTPFEVEYILENTASDLGEKGYDTTFGSGLVNPLAALSFDMSKLPERPDVSGDELLETAVPIGTDTETFEGVFNTPGTMHWYKADVAAGEHVQLELSGSGQYDYALELYFVPEQGEPVYLDDVDLARAGEKEGKLFTADENGTLLVGVKDANGNYSASGKSAFKLEAAIYPPIEPDDTTEPVAINALPFEKTGFTFFSGEMDMPDSDWFTIAAEEEELVSFSVSPVAGVNSAINVYAVEDGEQFAVASGNSQPAGKGETVSVMTVPGMTYQVEVTNAAFGDDIFFDSILELIGMDSGLMGEMAIGENAKPYTFTATSVELPADEDSFPDWTDEEWPMDAEALGDAYEAQQDAQLEEEEIEPFLPLEGAIDYEIGRTAEGFFQFGYDEDYYAFTSDQDGIYFLQVDQPVSRQASLTILEEDAETGELIPISGSDSEMDVLEALLGGFGESGGNGVYVALSAGKTYAALVSSYGDYPAADAYTLTSSFKTDVPDENDLDENTLELAAPIESGKAVQQYFIQNGDVDYFYIQNGGKDTVYTLDIEAAPLTAAQKQAIPAPIRPMHVFGGAIYEDLNGDGALDESEMSRVNPFGPDLFAMTVEPSVNTSFKAKADAGYFIEVAPFLGSGPNLQPYTVSVQHTFNQFADGDSAVKNHIPVKPLAMKVVNGQYGARGHFNAGIAFGDVDHFALPIAKNGPVSMTFQAGDNRDGVVAIYNSNGKLVASFDEYGKGDAETFTVNLTKGRYFVELSEKNGMASVKPYELIVKK